MLLQPSEASRPPTQSVPSDRADGQFVILRPPRSRADENVQGADLGCLRILKRCDDRLAHARELCARSPGANALSANPRSLKQQRQRIGEEIGLGNSRPAANIGEPDA